MNKGKFTYYCVFIIKYIFLQNQRNHTLYPFFFFYLHACIHACTHTHIWIHLLGNYSRLVLVPESSLFVHSIKLIYFHSVTPFSKNQVFVKHNNSYMLHLSDIQRIWQNCCCLSLICLSFLMLVGQVEFCL